MHIIVDMISVRYFLSEVGNFHFFVFKNALEGKNIDKFGKWDNLNFYGHYGFFDFWFQIGL